MSGDLDDGALAKPPGVRPKAPGFALLLVLLPMRPGGPSPPAPLVRQPEANAPDSRTSPSTA